MFTYQKFKCLFPSLGLVVGARGHLERVLFEIVLSINIVEASTHQPLRVQHRGQDIPFSPGNSAVSNQASLLSEAIIIDFRGGCASSLSALLPPPLSAGPRPVGPSGPSPFFPPRLRRSRRPPLPSAFRRALRPRWVRAYWQYCFRG